MPRFIRASEVGDYCYCHRAWWLRHIEGRTPDERGRLIRGTAHHARHGRVVRASAFLLLLGALLLAAGLAGLAIGR